MKLIETVTFVSPDSSVTSKLEEALSGDYPEVLYPEIRAITADKVTKNKTYYPVAFLQGDPKENTGVTSWLYPYPKPIIKDHQTGGGFFGGSGSDIYGRVKYASLVNKSIKNPAYVSVVPEITDPQAIQNILTGRFLTVSIGIEAMAVRCSICRTNIAETECDHIKGQMYNVKGKEKLCYWEIGPLQFEELSFVTVPSDDEAMVINTDIGGVNESFNIYGGRRSNVGEFILESTLHEYDAIRKYTAKLIESAEENDEICTLGDLYHLDEDDPDYNTPDNAVDTESNTEAPLSKKKRDALPDSAFCGPNRSFPAHDLAHAVAGLRLLGRYKGPGNKAKIRACLLRKAAMYRKRGDKLSAPGYLFDDKHLVEFPIFPIIENRIHDTVQAITNSNFNEEQKLGMYAAVAKYCDDNKIQLPNELKDIDGGEPLKIQLNKDTYPLLYQVIESLEAYILEVSMNEELETPKVEETPKKKEYAKPEVTVVPDENSVTESKEDTTPNDSEQSVETNVEEEAKQEDTNTAEQVDEAEQTEQPQQEQVNEAPAEEQPKVEENDLMKKYVESLAMTAALLMKTTGRVSAKNKSLEELQDILKTRSVESLTDTIEDLKVELAEITQPEKSKANEALDNIDLSNIEPVENPVGQKEEHILNTKYGFVTKPRELDDDENKGLEVDLATGMNIQKLNERAAKILEGLIPSAARAPKTN